MNFYNLLLSISLLAITSCGFNVELDSSDSGNTPVPTAFPNNVAIPNFLVAAYPGPGTYRQNVSVNINSIGFDDIYYCLSWSGECCDPNSVYSNTNIDVRDPEVVSTYSPGDYCLSFVGVEGDFQTAVQEYRYTINNQVPEISTRIHPIIGTNETLFIQTNQLNAYLRSDSDHFGQTNFFHTTHNLGALNPNVFSGCEDIYNNVPYSTQGLRNSLGNLETITLSESFVTTPLKKAVGINSYGENFIVSIMRFEDVLNGDTFGCNTNRVVLKDFSIFRPSLSGAYSNGTNVNGVMEFQGGVSHFGRFQGSLSGATSSPNQPYKLKTNFVDIVN